MKTAVSYCKWKVDMWFRRIFKEQAGGAELVATLVIVGIVLVLAFVFRDKIADLVKNLWNSIVKGDDPDAEQSNIVNSWD